MPRPALGVTHLFVYDKWSVGIKCYTVVFNEKPSCLFVKNLGIRQSDDLGRSPFVSILRKKLIAGEIPSVFYIL